MRVAGACNNKKKNEGGNKKWGLWGWWLIEKFQPFYFFLFLFFILFIYLFFLACNKKAEIFLLTTTLIAHLCSQFNHVFALLIPMRLCHVLKALIFAKIGLKASYFCKKLQNLRACPKTPLPPAVGSVAPKPQWLLWLNLPLLKR